MRGMLVVVTSMFLVGGGSCGDKEVEDVVDEPVEAPSAAQEETPAAKIALTVTITGTAENAKGGAVIVEDGGRVIYVARLDSWPDAVHGKAVFAEGLLVERQYLPVAKVGPDGGISQGTAGGDQWVLDDASWSVLGAAPPAAKPAGE